MARACSCDASASPAWPVLYWTLRDAVEAFRHGRAVASAVGFRSGQGLQEIARLLVGRQRLARLSCRLLQIADGDQALAGLQLGRGVGMRPRPPGPAAAPGLA